MCDSIDDEESKSIPTRPYCVVKKKVDMVNLRVNKNLLKIRKLDNGYITELTDEWKDNLNDDFLDNMRKDL